MILANVNVTDVEGGIGAMRRRLRAGELRASVFKPVAELLRGDIRAHFENRDGLEGTWPLPADLGDKRRSGRYKHFRVLRKGRSGPLQLTKRGARRVAKQLGRLRSAIEMTVFGTGVRALNIVGWAGIHEYGGTAGHGAEIPARSSMYADAVTVDRFQQLYLDNVIGAW